jgi:hypothetical protein
MPYLKTMGVAAKLEVTCYRLYELLRNRKLAPPSKDSSGDYIWLPEDVERARQALASGRRRRPANTDVMSA